MFAVVQSRHAQSRAMASSGHAIHLPHLPTLLLEHAMTEPMLPSLIAAVRPSVPLFLPRSSPCSRPKLRPLLGVRATALGRHCNALPLLAHPSNQLGPCRRRPVSPCARLGSGCRASSRLDCSKAPSFSSVYFGSGLRPAAARRCARPFFSSSAPPRLTPAGAGFPLREHTRSTAAPSVHARTLFPWPCRCSIRAAPPPCASRCTPC